MQSTFEIQIETKQNSNALSTFIDLFSGIGGFRIALESFGMKCLFSSEIDSFAKKTYCENFGTLPYDDIKNIFAQDIPAHDILCAGFPCQAFSISGKQKGFLDTRGTLFFEIVRIARFHKPKVLLLENVKNFEKHDKGNTLATIIRELDLLGYDTYYKVLNSSHFGMPTTRERIYIVSFRKDLNINTFSFPVPNYTPTKLEDYIDKNVSEQKYFINRTDIKIKNTKTYPNIFGNYPLKPIRIGTINKGGQGERIYSVYGHTITLSAHGGGAASKTGAYLIEDKVRKLTPRECARVMGFPETFKIPVTESQAYKQFGNSVVIPVVKSIFEKIQKRLTIIEHT